MKKKSKPFWERSVNAITGWKPARVKKTDGCIESVSLEFKGPLVFKPKGFR